MDKFEDLLGQITSRPVIYVGKWSLDAVSDYLYGYCHALEDNGNPHPLQNWGIWISRRFLIWHPGWEWTRVMRHVYGTDKDALSAIPALYAEYAVVRSSFTFEAIKADLEAQLMETHGRDWYEPGVTHTSCPQGDPIARLEQCSQTGAVKAEPTK